MGCLLPSASFVQAINRGATVNELEAEYDLSEPLIRYRIQVTGAHRLFHARQQGR